MDMIPTSEDDVRMKCETAMSPWVEHLRLSIHVSSESLQEGDMKDLALLLFLTFFEFGDLVS